MPRTLRSLALVVLAILASLSLHAKPADVSLLRGTIVLSDEAAVPPGALLRVHLRDLSPGVSKDATVATQSFHVEGKPPIEFELPYGENLIEPKRLYGVEAVITDSRGQPLWETRVSIRVLTLGNQNKVQLVLRPIEQPKAPPEPTSFTVDCGELHFDVQMDDAAATVVFPQSKVVLPRTETVAGKRYSDGPTTLAVSGSAVYLQWQSRAYRECKVRGK